MEDAHPKAVCIKTRQKAQMVVWQVFFLTARKLFSWANHFQAYLNVFYVKMLGTTESDCQLP